MSEVSTFAFQYHDNCTTYAICYWYLCSDLFLFFFFLIIQWLSHYDFNTYVMIALTLTTCKCHNEIVVYVCPDFAVQLTYCIYHLLNLMCDDQG